jgi:thiol-disulfide isomerase/thioredoxin
MIDKPETRAYLRARTGGTTAALILGFIGLLLLLPGQLMAGAVQDGNPGRSGETLDLKTLPVKGKTTVVDVYSPYCPPCMRLAPLLEQLAQQRPDLVIKKVNIQRPNVPGRIDWQSPLAKQLGLRSIPHFMIFDQQRKLQVEGKEAFQQVLSWLKKAGLLKQ